MGDGAAGEIMSKTGSVLVALFTVVTGAALAYWGPTVPVRIAGAERALRGLEGIHAALQSRKAKVDRRKKARKGHAPARGRRNE